MRLYMPCLLHAAPFAIFTIICYIQSEKRLSYNRPFNILWHWSVSKSEGRLSYNNTFYVLWGAASQLGESRTQDDTPLRRYMQPQYAERETCSKSVPMHQRTPAHDNMMNLMLQPCLDVEKSMQARIWASSSTSRFRSCDCNCAGWLNEQ